MNKQTKEIEKIEIIKEIEELRKVRGGINATNNAIKIAKLQATLKGIEIGAKSEKEEELSFLNKLYNLGFSNGAMFEDMILDRIKLLKKELKCQE